MKQTLATIVIVLVSLPARAGGKHFSVNYPPSKESGELAVEANFYLWIPDGAAALRGVIVHQHGCGDGAERGGVTASHDLHWQALARKWNCALLGSSYRAKGQSCRLWCDPRKGSDRAFRNALAAFAKQSRHPELTQVPWCLWGHSGGAFWASLMQVKHPTRIVAIWLRSGTAFGYWQKGEIPKPDISAAAYGIPVVCNPGVKERDNKRFRVAWDGALAMFKAYRARGAPIAFVPDPKTAHECGESRYLAIPFFDACLAARLPKTGASTATLRPIDRKRGFLVPLLGLKAVEAAEFRGDAKTASWLPDDGAGRLKRAWAAYVKTGTAVDDTPPPAPTQVVGRRAKNGDVMISWNAAADFESGLGGFDILRNGKPYATLPKKPVRRFGRPLFQGLTYHDTPTPPLPKMELTVPAADVKPGDRFVVISRNSVGLKSKPATARR
jgi:hypothetical protein